MADGDTGFVRVPAATGIIADANLPTGQMPGSTANNGIMYDTIVLEAD